MPVLTKINTNSIADDAVTGAKIPAGAVQASEIAAGGVSGADIGYLGDGSGNLSGTITNQQLHFGSAFTLTDNLTVNDNLTLAKLRDDGTGQSITGDGKTITGTGTLTMGNYIESHQLGVDVTTRVDGLSGVLGSAVTGGSGLDVITVTDQWLINTSRTSGTINGNWVRPWYTGTPGTYGTAWSNRGGGINAPNHSGHFSFKVTGLYLIFMTVIIREQTGGADANSGVALYVSSNNGSNFYKTIIRCLYDFSHTVAKHPVYCTHHH